MSKYDIVLFDLDGTISDPKVGITKSVQYALRKFGVNEPDLEKLTPFIGPPLHDSFGHFYGFDEKESVQAVEYFREYFKVKGMYENELYPGMPELLQSLKDASKVLVVATSKPTVFSEQILAHFNVRHYFDMVVGSNLDGTRSVKAEIIEYITQQFPQFDLNSFVMIGDRKYDIIGANTCGIDSIGVTYGHGSEDELTAAQCTYVAHGLDDLCKILIG